MFFTICLADADFFAAKMKVVVFGVAYRPAASVIVEVGQGYVVPGLMTRFGGLGGRGRIFDLRFGFFFYRRFGSFLAALQPAD